MRQADPKDSRTNDSGGRMVYSNHIGKGPCGNLRKREGRCPSRKGRGERILVATSVAYLKLRISERFWKSKDEWYANP
jgi:hypothetical protein